MAATGDTTEPAIHFKRRKIAHPRKTYTDDASAAIATSDAVPQVLQAPSPAPAAADAPLQATTLENEVEDDGDEESVPNLKEIFRQRKRPRDRLKEAARKAAEKRAGPLVLSEAPAANDQYSGRFVAQTGQVVDKDDAQMTAYVEARLAEKNHREYGWPIPKHLLAIVATLTPSEREPGRRNSDSPAPAPAEPQRVQSAATAGGLVETPTPKPDRDVRMAAGLGKLQEVDLGPEAMVKNLQRIEEARRRLEGGSAAGAAEEDRDGGRRKGKKARRAPRGQRRNSEDIKRDKLVEEGLREVLREAKLDYFEPPAPTTPPTDPNNPALSTDEAFYEHFRREYENQESTKVRKPPAPPTTAKGAKEPSKGPKLGGSRSARAAMAQRIVEEQKKVAGGRERDKRVIKEVGNTKQLRRDEFTPMDVGKPAWYAE